MMGATHFTKRCSKCKRELLVDQFYRNGRGRDAYCRECRRQLDRDRAGNSKAARTKATLGDPFFFRRQKLISLYGITHEDWMRMYEAQGGVCAICRLPEKRKLHGQISHLVVDHDHVTGRVRALLCHRCNTALGHVENPEFLVAALTYLARHRGACWFGQEVVDFVDDIANQLGGLR